MNNVKVFVSVVAILVIGVIATAVIRSGKTNGSVATSGELDQFAQCLGEQGAIFYGAYWCPHCNAQKKMFGSSAKLLPYIECSTLDGRGQTQECKDKGITGYPTWEFSDDSRLSGKIPLETLAAKTLCELPVGEYDVPEGLGETSEVLPTSAE